MNCRYDPHRGIVEVLEFNRPTGSFPMVQTVPVAGCCFGIYKSGRSAAPVRALSGRRKKCRM
jgi:hypothetical protein